MYPMKTHGVHGFYPVVDDVRWVRRFLPLGVRTIQLRIKGQPEAEVRRQIREALAIAADYDDCQMIVNDYWREAIQEGAAWVHLGHTLFPYTTLFRSGRASCRERV